MSTRIPPILHRTTILNEWKGLIETLNAESDVAKRTMLALADAIDEQQTEIMPWHQVWIEHCGPYFDLDTADKLLGEIVPASSVSRLFVLQAYCKIVLDELVAFAVSDANKKAPIGFFGWTHFVSPGKVQSLRDEIQRSFSEQTWLRHSHLSSNFLSLFYQEVFPPRLRHLTGEYYTPSWLVDYTIEKVTPGIEDMTAHLTVLDPSVGSGGFLAHFAIAMEKRAPKPLRLIGVDINPLAIEFCLVNLMLTAAALPSHEINYRVLIGDPILDVEEIVDTPLFAGHSEPKRSVLGVNYSTTDDWQNEQLKRLHSQSLAKQNREIFGLFLRRYVEDRLDAGKTLSATHIVGNPPWMSWDALTPRYREALTRQWASSSLITQKGWRAKIAAGKTDVSTLFVYRSAERHAVPNGRMGFVLPLSLFQSRHAGAGFRRFCTTEGRKYALSSLDDMSEINVFPDAANRPAVATFSVDAETKFPVELTTWKGAGAAEVNGHLTACQPIDQSDLSSPIVAINAEDRWWAGAVGPSDYRARGGINTGGANTLLWLDVVRRESDLLTVQNVGKTRKSSSLVRFGQAEEEVVRPMLVGTDIKLWKAHPSRHMLLFYSAEQPKKAIVEERAKELYPKAFEFACQFRSELANRKEYHRWGGVGPFYEVYRIGPYTFSPIKVVWQHTGFSKRLKVAVVEDTEAKVTVVDQKVILIACTCAEEAHYICAYLSSEFVSTILRRYLGTDASTHILDYISLRHYDVENKDHRRLASLSAEAHARALTGLDVTDIEEEIDRVVREYLQTKSGVHLTK